MASSTTRFPSHQLSNGLYVSGHPEQFKERQPSFKSTAMPYTGGDIKKSGELGKMFDIPVVEPSKVRKAAPPTSHQNSKAGFGGPSSRPNSGPLSSSGTPKPASGPLTSAGLPRQNSASMGQNRSGPLVSGGRPASHSGPLSRTGGDGNRPGSGSNSQKNSGPLSNSGAPMIVRQNSGSLLPATGLITSGPITSGPLNSSGAPKKPFSGPLDSSGAPSHKSSANHAINNISLQSAAMKKSLPLVIIWTVLPLFIMGFVAGAFILVTVHNPILLMVVGGLCVCVIFLVCWNLFSGDSSPGGFLATYEDADLRRAKDGQHVKVTGIVTCGSVPLESSYQRVSRCVYMSTGLSEYRGMKSKPARAGHRRFTWAVRYLERHVVDFYISDIQSGLRALVKAGYGAPVLPLVHEYTVVDVTQKNKDPPADFVRWMGSKNLSCDDRIMRLKEGYIKEGSTVTVMGIVQRHENVLMIIPPKEPVSMGCQWKKLVFPRTLKGLNISGNNFIGNLPIAFTNLTRLQYLDISHNSFNGSIPPEIFRLKSLLNFTAYSNNFTGPLPKEFLYLPWLRYFDLSGSYFTGPIPSEYGALASVEYLDLSGNLLNGTIPRQLGSLPSIRMLKLGWNELSGAIPPELGNLSATLEYLDLASAGLSGSIPAELGKLFRLKTLFLYKNELFGKIPAELGNLSALTSLDLSQNMLTGGMPSTMADLHNLTLLSLMYNNLSGKIPSAIAGLPKLTTFLIWNNSFSGSLPQQLGCSSSLYWFDASANKFSGSIPPYLCAGGNLYKLMLFSNSFSGPIPRHLASCKSLWRLRLENNQLSGRIPMGFGALLNFTYLDVSHNELSGPLPEDLLTAPVLQNLDVSFNPLSCTFPRVIWKMRSLQKLYASSCNISGNITVIEQCPPLFTLDLSDNLLIGNISSGFGLCQKLTLLNLANNRLSGPIPNELASLPVLSTLDLSYNHFSGSIPSAFQNATALEVLDVSYNNLSGTVPSFGLFKIINASMLAGNDHLCGGVLGACARLENEMPPSHHESGKKSLSLLAWVVGAIFAMTLVVLMAGFRCFHKQYRWYICRKLRQEGYQHGWKLTAFQRLSFTAEDIVQCLTTNNIIGMGAAGTVYRADVPSGEAIAVKKLWRSQKDVDIKEQHILGEVDVLGSVRHRNIVRMLGCCSSNDTTLLLYEYMPNGSLGDLLHGNKEANILADWMTRYKIAMGVAQGLCYLHHDCFPVVVHRDVKSNNILLDSNMEARVADFGLAKLIEATESMSVIAGSYGYIAPEYAYTMQVDEKSDIYSFGVVLLELLTGKRPIEPEYGDAVNIVEWVRAKVGPEGSCTDREVAEVLAGGVEGGAALSCVREEMTLVLRLALLCTSKAPIDRPSMRDVVTMLSEAKPRRKIHPHPHQHPGTCYNNKV